MSRWAVHSAGAVLVAGLLTAGCGTQARWVNCESRLEPINIPAPKAVDEPTPEEPESSGQAAP